MNEIGPKPLAGTRIIELAHLLAGPSVTALLADAGADVIKVEQVGQGDYARDTPDLGPSIWLNYNRGKKSVTLNLKKDEGLAIFYKLVETADAVVENYGPGAAERLKVSYEDLKRVKPDLIFCSVKGFTSTSSYRDRPGLDAVAQAFGGIMSVTGEPGRPPVRIGNSAVDLGTGAYGAYAILVALLRKIRGGGGAKLEVSLFDTSVYWDATWITYYSIFNKVAQPIGSAHPMWGGPYRVFKSKGGEWVFVGVTTDRQWPAFCNAMGLEKYASDPRFRTNADRSHNSELMLKMVSDIVASMESDDIVKRLNDAGVPCAPVRTMDKVATDEDLRARGIISDVRIPGGVAKVVAPPITTSSFEVSGNDHVPSLGENTDEILLSLGYDKGKIGELRSNGVI